MVAAHNKKITGDEGIRDKPPTSVRRSAIGVNHKSTHVVGRTYRLGDGRNSSQTPTDRNQTELVIACSKTNKMSSIVETNNNDTLATLTKNPSTALQSQEESLRAFVQDRPKNGRALAKLAYLLVNQADLVHDDKRGAAMRREALEWTHRSIQVAPEKPFGYISLSILEEDHSKRMIALRKAIQYHPDDETNFAKLILLIRLLREPIQHQEQQVSGKIGRAAARHPRNRPLNDAEEKLYAQSAQGLNGFWSNPNNNNNNTDKQHQQKYEMAMNEYRLGLFFRKRLPLEASRPRAQQHFLRAVKYLPEDCESAIASKFWLGTLGHTQLDRCPPSYVIGLYSTFAENFDSLLVEKLSYRTPTVLRQLVDKKLPHKFTRGIDLGCGTGLSGVAFCDKILKDWIGLDLSPAMIAKARERQCYSALQVGDVTTCLADQTVAHFDFVLACDVLVYLGDLQSVFDDVHRVLKSGGIFAFSTELNKKKDQDFVLHECARFSHSRAYIERLATSGETFDIVCMEKCPLRKNQGEDVMGNLAIMRKR